MSNDRYENNQGPTDTPNERPVCPAWCVDHSEIDAGTGMIHRSSERKTANLWVELSRCDFHPWTVVGAVMVQVNGHEPITLAEAASFAGELASTVAEAMREEQTIVRVVDWLVDQPYVIFEEAGVVCVSSHLDEDGRRRALSEAGVI